MQCFLESFAIYIYDIFGIVEIGVQKKQNFSKQRHVFVQLQHRNSLRKEKKK